MSTSQRVLSLLAGVVLWTLIKPLLLPWLVAHVAPHIVAVVGPAFGAVITALSGVTLCILAISAPQYLLVSRAKRSLLKGAPSGRSYAEQDDGLAGSGETPAEHLRKPDDTPTPGPLEQDARSEGAGLAKRLLNTLRDRDSRLAFTGAVLLGIFVTLLAQYALRAMSVGFVQSYQNALLKRGGADPTEAVREITNACANGEDPSWGTDWVNRAAAAGGLFPRIEVRRSLKSLAWRIEPEPSEIAFLQLLLERCRLFKLELRIRFLDSDGYEVLGSNWQLTRELLSTASALKGEFSSDDLKGIARADLSSAEARLMLTKKSVAEWIMDK